MTPCIKFCNKLYCRIGRVVDAIKHFGGNLDFPLIKKWIFFVLMFWYLQKDAKKCYFQAKIYSKIVYFFWNDPSLFLLYWFSRFSPKSFITLSTGTHSQVNFYQTPTVKIWSFLLEHIWPCLNYENAKSSTKPWARMGLGEPLLAQKIKL